jgi:glycosyltransferase involved in cell wall biosynthesis
VLTIVYPKIRVFSGIKTYVETVLKGLTDAKYRFTPVGVRKMEFSLSGKPIGGIASQRLGLSFHRNLGHPIHALVPELSPEGVDIVTIHDIIPVLKPSEFIKTGYDKSAYGLMYDRALKARTFVVSTETVKRELMTALNIEDERVEVIYQGIDSAKFAPNRNNPFPDNGKVHLITVGDFNPRKKFDQLYEIVSKEKDMELYHLGPVNSWSERASSLAEFARKSGNIFLKGEVDEQTLTGYLTNADLFVFISEAEGFGLPPIEAMACGTNVVLNDLPIFRETVGEFGFLTSIDKFADTLNYALKNKKSAEVLRNRSLNFSINKEITDLIKIYSKYESN